MKLLVELASTTAAIALSLLLPVSNAFNTPSQYVCQDFWIDPSANNARSTLFPDIPPTGQSIAVIDAVQTSDSVSVPILFGHMGSPPTPPFALHGTKVEGASLLATLTFPLRFPTPMTARISRENLKFPKLSPGDYRIGLQLPYGCVQGIAASGLGSSIMQWILRVPGAQPTVIVSTLAYLPESRNFMTASLDDVQFLRATPELGASFALLDDNFRAWPVTGDAPSNVAPVCRFFRASTVTHAYSADAAECASLRANAEWKDEGLAFRALIPTNGVCASGTEPIYKLTNATLGDTQRYTRSEMTYRTLALNGWAQRGIAFCSPVG